MDTTVADPLIGALVDGRYRVRARVARGGMATVYTALDERLERTVALKIIHPAQSHDPRFVDRFTDEAKTIARLTHPNIVAVYDQGTHQGLPYLVMEFVRGRTLRELLAERRRLAPQEALAIMEQVLAAVAAAHRAGLVHRDVKPENVLVAEAPGGGHNLIDGVVKVADFGLARAVEASADEHGSHLMATVAYVAPELVTDGHADPRTDVYSAGIVLFEMLTGRVPYEGDRPVDVAWQHVDRDVPPPSRFTPGLPAVLDDLVARATRRDPGGRPTDAGAMLAEVQATREDIGVALTPRTGPLAQPTVIVPRVESSATQVNPAYQGTERPSWSRLPGGGLSPAAPQPGRRAAAVATGGGLRDALVRLNANPRGRLALVAALLTLGLLVAVGGWWFGVGRYTDAPDLTNMTKQSALAQANTGGFKIKFAAGEYREDVPKDKVLRQDPAPGGRVLDGGTITLTLSKGPEVYKVPDDVGKSLDLALEDFNSLKVKITQIQQYDDQIPQGSVSALDPKAGSDIRPGAELKVYISKGPNPVKIPNVVGKNVNDAKNTLDKLGVKSVFNYVDNDQQPKDTVLSQDVNEGTGVNAGMTVTMTVSKGPSMVTIPDVRNMPIDQATQALQQLGLQVQVIGFGTVRNTNPGVGSQVAPGSTVILFAAF